MKIAQILPHSQEWFDWRRNGITATDVAVIMGLSPYTTPYQLWQQKMGYVPPVDLSANKDVQRGVAMEAPIRTVIEEQINDMLLPLCGESEETPIMRASFDGVDANNVPHEIKAPCGSVYAEVVAVGRESKAYKTYYPQVQAQIYVSGAEHGFLYFGQEIDGELELQSFKIDRDKPFIDQMLHDAHQFWALMENNTPPAMDPDRDVFIPSDSAASQWANLASQAKAKQDRLLELKAEMDALKGDMDAIEQEAATLMGQFKTGEFDGMRITRVCRRGNVNYKNAFKALLPAEQFEKLDTLLDDYRNKDSSYLKMTITKDVNDVSEAI